MQAETLPLVMPFNTPAKEVGESRDNSQIMAQLALTHTALEHRLYQALLSEVSAARTRVCTFSLRQLMTLTQLPNYTAVRRGIRGLVSKLSIEQHRIAGAGLASQTAAFLVFTPREIFARRAATQFSKTPSVVHNVPESKGFAQAIERLAGRYDLSRREAQVALYCVQGMTNAQIAEQLYICEQTVKFHLRHIFVKYGVKRRAELIARLLGADAE
ncbi:MAG TPA: LuxR C-terminal-related transcriptional regulator [Blastocatellia bacterium]|nr:LuxR C-terminal-related transcriptional regulator [Blastocatellia bacterium]